MKAVLLDLIKRLWTLLVLFQLIANLAAFLSFRVPDEALLRLHGITGEVLYQYPVASACNAYIVRDEAEGTVSFLVLSPARQEKLPLMPDFKDIWYGAVVRTSDLQPLRIYYLRYSTVAADEIFCMQKDLHRVSHGDLRVEWLNMGITREQERLEGQTLLFQKEIGDATVFCFETDTKRAILTEEDLRQNQNRW